MVETSNKMPVASAANRRSTWQRTTVLWMVNVAMFVAVYAMATDSPTSTGALTTIVVCVALLLASVGIGYVFAFRKWRRANTDINKAVAALSRGQLQLAHDTFARWCESSNAIVASVARHNLGWTLMRQGRLDEALAVVSDNDSAHEGALERIGMHATSSADLALYSALLGKLDDAESWLGITEQRAAAAALPSLAALRVFARAVIDCRQNRCEEAARLLDERWAECEAVSTGSELRPMRVLRAYAHAAAGPRNAGVAESLLAAAKPVYDGEYDFLGVVWPEMQTFLVSHRLVRDQVA